MRRAQSSRAQEHPTLAFHASLTKPFGQARAHRANTRASFSRPPSLTVRGGAGFPHPAPPAVRAAAPGQEADQRWIYRVPKRGEELHHQCAEAAEGTWPAPALSAPGPSRARTGAPLQVCKVAPIPGETKVRACVCVRMCLRARARVCVWGGAIRRARTYVSACRSGSTWRSCVACSSSTARVCAARLTGRGFC